MAEAIEMLVGSMNADLEQLRAVSSNLANISTNGYKAEQVTFETLWANAQGANSSAGLASLGFPQVVADVQRHYAQGTLKPAQDDMSVAIDGEGFFVVRNDAGEFLTRRGDLSVDAAGRLALRSGARLQGMQGDIFVGQDAFEVNAAGGVLINGREIDRLLVVNVDQIDTTDYLGGGLIAKPEEVTVNDIENYAVLQGFHEVSNVNATSEMLKMMEIIRHFETNSRVVRAYDQMLQNSINDLGKF